MGADDSLRKLKRKKNTKKRRENSEMRNSQLAKIEEDFFRADKKKKNKKSSDVIANKEDVKMFGLPNIKANGAPEITGGNKKSKKLRNNKRKTGKIAKTRIDESDMPDSNEVGDRTSGKKDAANEAREEKLQNSRKKKRKNNESVKRAAEYNEEKDASEQHNDEEMACATQSEPKDLMTSSEGLNEVDTRRSCKTGKSKNAAKKKKKRRLLANELSQDNFLEKRVEVAEDEVHQMSSGDEDYSKGMKKWVMQYHQSRPGIKVLQERIDDFITAHEAQEEKARKEREDQAAEGGWTVVVHHKGRKKTTDAESGIAVGSVAQAAVLDKMAKKKNKEVGVDFYRFQRREAHRNEIMMLQSKFEQDKKRIQQMRAARKFRPY